MSKCTDPGCLVYHDDSPVDIRAKIAITDPEKVEGIPDYRDSTQLIPHTEDIACIICHRPIDISIPHWQRCTTDGPGEPTIWQGAWHTGCGDGNLRSADDVYGILKGDSDA